MRGRHSLPSTKPPTTRRTIRLGRPGRPTRIRFLRRPIRRTRRNSRAEPARPKYVPSTQFRVLNRLRGTLLPQILPDGNRRGGSRRNAPAFKYIIDNNLWHLDGLTFRHMQRVSRSPFRRLDRDQGSLEGESTQSESTFSLELLYFWETIWARGDSHQHQVLAQLVLGDFWNTSTIRTVASSIELPRFVWHCPAQLERRRSISGLAGPGAAASLGSEWENYRIDGAQIDFIDSTGRFTRMGNSIIEDGSWPNPPVLIAPP